MPGTTDRTCVWCVGDAAAAAAAAIYIDVSAVVEVE